MQLSDVTHVQPGLTAVAHPSLAIDLSWAIHASFQENHRQRHAALGALYRDHPDLAARLMGFWADDPATAGTCALTEFEILAWHAGALGATDAGQLFGAIEEAAGTVPTDLRLRSEEPRQRQAFLNRLVQLRRAPKRRAWLALLAEVHDALDGSWDRARSASAMAAEAFNREMATAADWASMVAIECEESVAMLSELGTAGYRQVSVVPSVFFGKAMVLDLPDTLLVGIGAPDEGAAARARTETLARRLKTLADPTRLAILDFLADGSHSVGEVATAFGLAQPTVSSHVKQLREAGLLVAERRGNRLHLTPDRDALRGIVDQLAVSLR